MTLTSPRGHTSMDAHTLFFCGSSWCPITWEGLYIDVLRPLRITSSVPVYPTSPSTFPCIVSLCFFVCLFSFIRVLFLENDDETLFAVGSVTSARLLKFVQTGWDWDMCADRHEIETGESSIRTRKLYIYTSTWWGFPFHLERLWCSDQKMST